MEKTLVCCHGPWLVDRGQGSLAACTWTSSREVAGVQWDVNCGGHGGPARVLLGACPGLAR